MQPSQLWTDLAKHLAFGGGVFYTVMKLFDVMGDRINDDTRLQISIWLLDVNVGKRVEPWPRTVTRIFEREFGTKHLSWRCFRKSSLVSLGIFWTADIIIQRVWGGPGENFKAGFQWTSQANILSRVMSLGAPFLFVVPWDYLSLLETRSFLKVMVRRNSLMMNIVLLVFDYLATGFTAIFGIFSGVAVLSLIAPFDHSGYLLEFTRHYHGSVGQLLSNAIRFTPWFFVLLFVRPSPYVISAAYTSCWLWLYAGSGFILKSAHRWDIGFQWFNAHMDIDKKPLQSIGLLAGSIAALIYWLWTLLFFLQMLKSR